MTQDCATVIDEIVEQYGRDRSRLMDITRAVHGRLGYLPEDAMRYIPKALGVHRVEVRDMASFYAFFSWKPMGKTVIRLCHAVVERMKGADDVARAFEKAAGCSFGETSEDGAISLAYTSCIGMSDQAPSALMELLHGDQRPPNLADAQRQYDPQRQESHHDKYPLELRHNGIYRRLGLAQNNRPAWH